MESPQELFWKNQITYSYVSENSHFNEKLSEVAWRKILNKVDTDKVKSYLDCGSNIGRNIAILKKLLPLSTANFIEIAQVPYDICKSSFEVEESFLGSIKNAKFQNRFDLVFTMGVLIHINPDELLETMQNMFNLASNYIIFGEYFNRTPVTLDYRGEKEKLFKRDFGKLFLENFNCNLVDYGFLWGSEFDEAGFDDITFWVFKK